MNHDPFRGYDQWKTASPYDEYPNEPENCDFAQAFPDYESPADLYRATYKYTACGPSVGFHERRPDNAGRWHYCSDLLKLGTWDEINERGIILDCISVSSIVEGVDAEVEATYIDCDPYGGDDPEIISKDYWNAVEYTNERANEIWNETHGCETCTDGESRPGDTPVNPDCPNCGGNGIVI